MTSSSSLRRFISLLFATSRRTAAVSVAVTIGVSFTEGIGILLLIPLLQLVGLDTPQGPLGQITATFGRVLSVVGVRPTLAIVLVIYVGIVALQGLLQRWQTYLSVGLQEDIVVALRTRLYRAIARAEWVFVARRRSSEFTHALTNAVDRAGASVYYLNDLFVTTLVSLVYLAFAFRFSPVTTTVVILCAGLLAWTARARLIASRGVGERLSAATGRLYGAISEHLGSLKTAKSYGAEDRHVQIFAGLSSDLRDVSLKAYDEHARLRQVLALGASIVLAVVVFVSFRILAMPAAQLLLVLFLYARLMPRLTGVYERVQALAGAMPSFALITELEDSCSSAAEPRVERQVPLVFKRNIALEGVSFDYGAGARAAAVQGVSLRIDAGATTAIVGPSGAGKSTLADLVMGLLTPDQGRICVDGRALTPDSLTAWRDQIGYVAQETFLFHDTVRANLLWARPGASEDDLWHALRLAAADQFVATLPQGLDTVVGDRGVLISGGERQRLSLARALLRKPNLLILDEATSSLDSENELRIQRAIDGLQHQMTILVITHRLSTIRTADTIHVLDAGRLIESGSWDQLMLRPSRRFRDLCEAQGLESLSMVTDELKAVAT